MKNIITKNLIILGIGIVSLYLIGFIYYSISYYPNTMIGNINISDCSKDEVNDFINKNFNNYSITLINGDYKYVISPTVSIDDNIKDLISLQRPYIWFLEIFNEHNLSLNITDNDIDDEIKEFMKGNIESKNACICFDEVNNNYYIQKETYGNQIKPEYEEELKGMVNETIAKYGYEIDFSSHNILPNITSKDKELVESCNKLNSIISTDYKIVLSDKTVNIDKNTILSFIDCKNNKVVVNEKIIRKYVDDLASHYNTFGKVHTFKTAGGKELNVNAVDYGWKLDEEKTFANICNALNSQEPEIEAIFSRSAMSLEENDFGNTYIEINLYNQHLWCYKDGNLITDFDIVSGTVSNNHATPEGIYNIDAVIDGQYLQGDGYKTWVDYWMPFNGNIGIHDASWRSAFGGNIYINSGSHGCINCPHDKAKIVFENVKWNEAVIVYNDSEIKEESKTVAADIMTEKENKKDFSKSVLIGDSISVGFKQYIQSLSDDDISRMLVLAGESFGINNAFSADGNGTAPEYNGKTDFVWNYMDDIKPEAIYFALGTNDLYLSNISSKYQEFVNKVIEHAPEAEIFIISIPGVTVSGEKGVVNNDNIKHQNENIKQMCMDKGYTYIDINSPLSDGKGLDAKYSSDNYVHQNKDAYEIWVKTLKL